MSRSQLTSTDQQNSGGPVSPYVAGKNKIINGDFGVWQRGTSFSATNLYQYTADRWFANCFTGVTATVSQQAFTAGSAPVSGYESAYYATWTGAASPSQGSYFIQRIEDVRTLANQAVTISFWARATSTKTITVYFDQNFGSGGSATASTTFSSGQTLTTSWQRYSFTATLGSLSGKTIGAGSFLGFTIQVPQAQGAFSIDIWGVQLEAGSVATPFTTATGTLSGELAACQRYYFRQTASNSNANYALGMGTSTTLIRYVMPMPATMRVTPTAIDYNLVDSYDGSQNVPTSLTIGSGDSNPACVQIQANYSSGATQYRPYILQAYNSTASYVGLNAEL